MKISNATASFVNLNKTQRPLQPIINKQKYFSDGSETNIDEGVKIEQDLIFFTYIVFEPR